MKELFSQQFAYTDWSQERTLRGLKEFAETADEVLRESGLYGNFSFYPFSEILAEFSTEETRLIGLCVKDPGQGVGDQGVRKRLKTGGNYVEDRIESFESKN